MLCIFRCCMCSYCGTVNSVESLKPLIRVNVLRVSDALDAILMSSGAAHTGNCYSVFGKWRTHFILCAIKR